MALNIKLTPSGAGTFGDWLTTFVISIQTNSPTRNSLKARSTYASDHDAMLPPLSPTGDGKLFRSVGNYALGGFHQ